MAQSPCSRRGCSTTATSSCWRTASRRSRSARRSSSTGFSASSTSQTRSSAQADRGPAARVEVRRRDVPRWWPADDVIARVGDRRVRLPLRAVGNVLVGLVVALEAVRTLRDERMRALLVVYPKQHFLLAGAL